jgi:hypothetical protein
MKLSGYEWLAVAALGALLVTGFFRYPVATSTCVAGVVLWFVARKARLRRRLMTQGWAVVREGRDDIVYIERTGDELRKLTINGELGTPHAIFVPSDEEWERSAPSWALGRKGEILARLKAELNPGRYEVISDAT